MILHNLEEILDTYPTELGRILTEIPSHYQVDKICQEKDIDPSKALSFRIALKEWIVVAKEIKPYKSHPLLK